MTQELKCAFSVLLAVSVWFAPAAKADAWDKQTILTFNEPVEIPGQVLPAGTYVFKLADSESNRTIVQIFTEDQQHLLATILAIPAYRLERTDKTSVSLEERPSGSPQALHKWFYPGDNYGFEFIYPKPQQEYVAQTPPPAPAAEAAPAPTEAAPTPSVADKSEAPSPVLIDEEEQVIIAQVTQAGPPDNAEPTENDTAPQLPQTAGNFAIILLIGIALLCGGFTALRFATKQS